MSENNTHRGFSKNTKLYVLVQYTDCLILFILYYHRVCLKYIEAFLFCFDGSLYLKHMKFSAYLYQPVYVFTVFCYSISIISDQRFSI